MTRGVIGDRGCQPLAPRMRLPQLSLPFGLSACAFFFRPDHALDVGACKVNKFDITDLAPHELPALGRQRLA